MPRRASAAPARAAQLREGTRSDPPAGLAVRELEEVVGVREHEGAVSEGEDVELDHVHALCDRALQRRQRVLRRERGGATVADAPWSPVLSERLDHDPGAVGSGVSSRSPPSAAYSTIIRSVIHSTGA